MSRWGVYGIAILLCLGCASQGFSQEVVGATPGTGGDSLGTTYHFDSNNTDFQMTLADETPLLSSEVPLRYGTAFQVFNNSQDHITALNLNVLGADLSGANWTTEAYPTAGNVAIDPANGRFKFAAPYWQGASYLDFGFDAGYADVAMNNAGQNYTVFAAVAGDTLSVYARHYDPALGWQEAVAIDNGVNPAINPAIAMNEAGYAICVFFQNDGSGNYRTYANRFVPGSGWQGAELIGAGLSAMLVYPPALAMDSSGRAITAFAVGPPPLRLYGNNYDPATGWYSAVTIDATTLNVSSYVSAGISDNGEGMISFLQETSPSYQRVYASHFTPASGWQSAVEIDGNTLPVAAQRMAMNRQGYAICAFAQSDGSFPRLFTNHYDPAAGWQGAAVIDAVDNSATTRFDVAINESGRAVTIFEQYNDANRFLYANHYAPGTGWQGSVVLDNQAINFERPSVDMSATNDVVCVYIRYDGSKKRLYSNRYESSLGWRTPEIIDHGNYNVTRSLVAMNDTGLVLSAFEQNDGERYRVYANRLVYEQPFGTVQVNYHKTSAVAPLPTSNALTIANRKIMPLQGGKVSIQLALAQAGKTTIKIYTLQGRLVKTLANEYLTAGSYTYDWAALNDSGDLIASGVYIIRVQAPGIDETQKVVVIK